MNYASLIDLIFSFCMILYDSELEQKLPKSLHYIICGFSKSIIAKAALKSTIIPSRRKKSQITSVIFS